MIHGNAHLEDEHARAQAASTPIEGGILPREGKRWLTASLCDGGSFPLPKYRSSACLDVEGALSLSLTIPRRCESKTSARRAGGTLAKAIVACRWLRFGRVRGNSDSSFRLRVRRGGASISGVLTRLCTALAKSRSAVGSGDEGAVSCDDSIGTATGVVGSSCCGADVELRGAHAWGSRRREARRGGPLHRVGQNPCCNGSGLSGPA